MSLSVQPSTLAPQIATARQLLQDLLADFGPRDFAVRFWEGTTWSADDDQPTHYTLALKHPGALRQMLWPSRLGLPEAYIYDDFDIEGDIHAFFRLIQYLATRQQAWGLGRRLRFLLRIANLPRQTAPRTGRAGAELQGTPHSRERDRQAISYHYDVSNEFYQLWLDRRMVYTCAYFASSDEDLDTAQERKLDLICRKLRLQPGERLLDIGCGWGGLILHAAERFGAQATGVTLSQKQAQFAEERIRQAGLQDRCRVIFRDYRDLTDWGHYDKLTSICVQEAIGTKELPKYFQQLWRLLRPGGLFLSQAITVPMHFRVPRGQTFAKKYVFPDGELQTLPQTLDVAERAGFEVRDVECLRDHYPLTLKHWVRRLEEHAAAARQLCDDVAYRVWRLYMAGAADRFLRNDCGIAQTLFLKPDNGKGELPLTRHDWYA